MFATLKTKLVLYRSQILFLFIGLATGWLATSVLDAKVILHLKLSDTPFRVNNTVNQLSELRLAAERGKIPDLLETQLDQQIIEYPAIEKTLHLSNCRPEAKDPPHPISLVIAERTLRKTNWTPDPLMIAKMYRESYPSSGPLAAQVEQILEPVKINWAYARGSVSAVGQLMREHQTVGIPKLANSVNPPSNVSKLQSDSPE